MKTKNTLFLTLLLAIFLQTASAQDLDQLPLDQPMSILEGKAFLDLPAGAVNIGQVPDPQSPLYHEHGYTVIRLVLGEDSLRFWATNEFFFAGDGYLEKWLSPETPLENNRKVLLNQDGLVAVLLTPEGFDATKERVHLLRLFVRTPDNLLFRISVDINQAALPRKDAYLQLAERVLRTLRVGEPDKGLSPRQETCAIATSNQAVRFELPPRYYILRHDNRSLQTFSVRYYYADEMGELWHELALYFAEASDLRFQYRNVPEKDIRHIKGTFLGEKTKWQTYEESGRSTCYVREQLFPFESLGPGIQLHVRMTTNDPKRLDEMTKIAEGIRLVER
jgi:hypothetical protein